MLGFCLATAPVSAFEYVYGQLGWWIFDTTPPTITNAINHTHTVNTSFSYDIDATDATGIDSWSVNDSNWAIDSSGILTNNTALDTVQLWWLNVSVNDTLNFTSHAVFYVNVTSVSDTCTYGGSGDYYVDCSDACTWSSPFTINGDWILEGTGEVTLLTTVTITAGGRVIKEKNACVLAKSKAIGIINKAK